MRRDSWITHTILNNTGPVIETLVSFLRRREPIYPVNSQHNMRRMGSRLRRNDTSVSMTGPVLCRAHVNFN